MRDRYGSQDYDSHSMNAIATRLSLAATLLMAVPAFGASIVLAGGTCIDLAGIVTPDCTVVVTNGRYSVTRRSAARILPKADETIDVSGQWIVPGFVDNHVHLGRVEADPGIWIRAGVTTLVDNGSSLSPAELARRYRGGPHIEACGPIITAVGGYPAVGQHDAPAMEVSGSEDAARKTAALIERARPACIKIAIERGFLADLSAKGWPALGVDEVAAIVKEAHARGLTVRAHVTQRHEFDLAVQAGVDVIAHSPIEVLPDASLQGAARRHVIMVSTVALWGEGQLRSAAVHNLVRYLLLGGTIALGSDYPNWKTAGLPIEELRALRGAGLTPTQLLAALTRHTVATSIDRADLVVLRGDPTRSVEALREIALVIRDGVIVARK